MEEEKQDEEMAVLFHASKLGRTDIVQRAVAKLKEKLSLSQQDVEEAISAPNEDGATALHIAAFHGHADVVRALLNLGARPLVALEYGEYSFKSPYEVANHSAIQAFHVYLFEQIAMGNNDAIEKLVTSGVPVDLADDSAAADSTLHWAVNFNNIDAAQMLLDLGVPVDIVNTEGQSSLHLACKMANAPLVKLLLQWGADADIHDENGRRPIDFLKGDSSEIFAIRNMLDDAGNEVDMRSLSSNGDHIDSRRIKTLENDESSCKQLADESCGSYVVLDKKSHDYSDDEVSIQNSDVLPEGPNSVDNREASSVSSSNDYNTHLILWPPAQRQCQNNVPNPHVIDLNQELQIFCDEGFKDALDDSRLLTTLRGVGVSISISSDKSQKKTSLLWLCVDQNVCPGRHCFEINIDVQNIRLTASDTTGLMYAVNAFVQVLKLQSDYITRPTSENASLIVNYIKIPAITITDWPNTPNRGVLWSFQRNVRTKINHLRDFIIFMSELRINQLFLRLNVDDFPKTSGDAGDYVNDSESFDGAADGFDDSFLSELVEVNRECHRHFVEIVLTFVISSSEDRIPISFLHQHLGGKLVALLFNFGNEPVEEVRRCMQLAFDDLAAAGHSSILYASNENQTWASELNIKNIAVVSGLNTVHHSMEIFLPKYSMCRSLTCTKDFAKFCLERSKLLSKSQPSSLALFPAFSSSDFFYPTILLKHMSFLLAGAAWNHESMEDILGSDLDDHSMLRPTLSTLLFQAYNPTDSSCLDSEDVYQNTLLDILSSDDIRALGSVSSQSQLNDNSGAPCPQSPRSHVSQGRSNLEVEGDLWSVISSSAISSSTVVSLSKEEVVQVMKKTKSCLGSIDWNINSVKATKVSDDLSVSRIELEEYFRVLNLVGVVCKVIVLALNSHNKPALPFRPKLDSAEPKTFAKLMESLSPGTSSDLANSILESMTLCSSAWTSKLNASFSVDSENQNFACSLHDLARKRYFDVKKAELPLLAIFDMICNHMPNFSTEVLMKIFEEESTTDADPSFVLPTGGSWLPWI